MFKINIIKILFAISIFSACNISYAAEDWSEGDWTKINSMMGGASGKIYIYTDGTEHNPIGCEINYRYVLSMEHPGFNPLYGLLITAYNNGDQVKMHVSNEFCETGSPKILYVSIKPNS
ncbi:hypothetical protein ACJJH9_16770 [Microbulbifer sp. DLAB2-AF]|uniref:hypothetical protein n=1 Tax=Microbulbifer sp. DLAB2-AF TaxID=3243395 RepID=UPI004039C161